MRFFILSLALLFCSNVFAAAGPVGTLGQQETVTIGGHAFIGSGTTSNTNANTIILFCITGAPNNGATCTFRKGNGSSGYTPSGSNKFYLYAFSMCSQSTTSPQAELGYSTNDVGLDSGTAFTGYVGIAGMAAGTSEFQIPTISTGNSCYQWSLQFSVPNGDYLGVKNNSAAVGMFYIAYGYEGT